MASGRFPPGAILACGLLWANGCAINPVSGWPEFVTMSAERERQIGAEQAKAVEREVGLVGDPELAQYLDRVGERVAARSPRTDVHYRFHVVDMAEPNAFALPSGDVYVSRGMLVLLNSEDELACVVGHEIGHVAARHAVQRASRGAPIQIVTGVASAVTGLASPLLGDVVGGVGQLTTNLVVAPYSRGQEREADRLGQEFAAGAGWDPAALSSSLRALEREEQLRGAGRRAPGFFASHPSTPERVAATAAYAGEVRRAAVAPISDTRDAFLQHLDGLVVGTPASEGVFEGQAFLHPDLGFFVRFPDGWRTFNTRTQIGAVPRDGGALSVLQAVGEGNDPQSGARALERAARSAAAVRAEPVRINGLQAARAHVAAAIDGDAVDLDLTWIACEGYVYQVAGIAPIARADAFRSRFRAVAESFRPLAAAEREGIREERLRLVAARAGETPNAVAARTRSSWSGQMVAIANDLDAAAPLSEDRLLKVAVSEPYGTP